LARAAEEHLGFGQRQSLLQADLVPARYTLTKHPNAAIAERWKFSALLKMLRAGLT